MVTGELKSKIDSLWEIFWTGGLTNPLDVIEQMTYLMFIHDLDDSDNTRAKEAAMLGLPYESIFAKELQIGDRTIDGSQLKWSVFHDFPAGKMYSTVQEWVFPFIKELHGDKESAYSKYMSDAIFKIPTPLMLDKIVTAMDGIYEQMAKLKTADTPHPSGPLRGPGGQPNPLQLLQKSFFPEPRNFFERRRDAGLRASKRAPSVFRSKAFLGPRERRRTRDAPFL